MTKLAQFHFEGRLNDFLTDEKKGKAVDYIFLGKPSIKDAIEALGIPHVEVGRITNYGLIKSSDEFLCDSDQIRVLPLDYQIPESGCRFLADNHLGKLVKGLRMLGFDTSCQDESQEKKIVALAIHENRILLTRSVNLLKYNAIKLGYWIRSEDPMEQIKDVVNQFGLKNHFRPFTRCLDCNAPIIAIPKAEIEDQLPEKTKQVFDEFFQCTGCKKNYWKGSHYDRMQNFIQQVE